MTPGDITGLSAALWDFGRLVLEGPLLVNADVRDEPAMLVPVIAIARSADHALLAEALVAEYAGTADDQFRAWRMAGAGRFIKDYLAPELTATPAHIALIDAGLTQLRDHGMLGVVVCPEVLSAIEARRLEALEQMVNTRQHTGM